MLVHPIRLRPAVVGLLLFGLSAGLGARSVRAEDASRWDGDARSSARLIAGAQPTGGAKALRAGIEIKLKPGWHTYWRYPGDAGVPPRFDFDQSQNVKSVEVRWPAPQQLPEDGLVTIGYDRDVILPLAITPKDASKPVALRLKLDYAICEKLCVPAQAEAELTLGRGPSGQEIALSAAEARVPEKLGFGRDGNGGLAIRSVRREGGEHPRVVVDVARPSGTSVMLLAEGPTPEWALPVPEAVAGAPEGLQRFAFDLDGAPPGAGYANLDLTLTAVGEKTAIEVALHLD